MVSVNCELDRLGSPGNVLLAVPVGDYPDFISGLVKTHLCVGRTLFRVRDSGLYKIEKELNTSKHSLLSVSWLLLS